MILETASLCGFFMFLGMAVQDTIHCRKYRKTKLPIAPFECLESENPTLHIFDQCIRAEWKVSEYHSKRWYAAYTEGMIDFALATKQINVEEARVLLIQKDHAFLMTKKRKADQTECSCPKPHPVSQVETNNDVGNL